MFKWIPSVISWGFGKLGYYKMSQINSMQLYLARQVNELNNELAGMLFAIGDLEARHNDMLLVITGLMQVHAQEEITLKTNFLQELYNKGYTVKAENDSNGDINVKVVTVPINNNGEGLNKDFSYD